MNLEKRKGIPSLKGYYKARSGEIFHYDSLTELATMMWLDITFGKWKKNTKLRIPYLFEGKNRKYIPDFIIESNDPITILEIKGSNDKPELPFKFEAAENFCKQNEMEFTTMSYQTIRSLVDWEKVTEYHYKNKISHETT